MLVDSVESMMMHGLAKAKNINIRKQNTFAVSWSYETVEQQGVNA